jgi:hypothetical protein
MDRTLDATQLLLELDARHDELLRRLDELDKDVARVLKETQLLVKTDATLRHAVPAGETEQPSLPANFARAA